MDQIVSELPDRGPDISGVAAAFYFNEETYRFAANLNVDNCVDLLWSLCRWRHPPRRLHFDVRKLAKRGDKGLNQFALCLGKFEHMMGFFAVQRITIL